MAHTLLRSRLVAFLDVLGFSHRMESEDLGSLHSEYADLIDAAHSKVFDAKDTSGVPSNNFAWSRFVFDSLIAVSNDLDGEAGPRNAFKFVAALGSLFELCFARRLPLRGCVGYGDVLEDPERSILLCPTFPTMVSLEKDFEWAGAVLLPDAAPVLLGMLHHNSPGRILPCANHFFVPYAPPLKRESATADWWCLNWVHLASDADLQQGLSYLDERKRPGTAAFIDFVQQLPSQGGPLPEACRPATQLRLQIARSGMRIKFADARGNGVDPPDGLNFKFSIHSVVPSAPAGSLSPRTDASSIGQAAETKPGTEPGTEKLGGVE